MKHIKISFTNSQKILLTVLCFGMAVIGFMVRLPSVFRHMDKELHALFYFIAAAFLNLLFAKTNLIKHILIFVFLYLFGVFIEYAQGYSNKFFRKRIHGRFDPADIQSNLNGLIAFSALWLVCTVGIVVYKRVMVKNKELQ